MRQKKYPNNLKNFYKGFTDIIEEKSHQIIQMEEEIKKLKSDFNHINLENCHLKYEVTQLLEQLKISKSAKTKISNMCNKIQQENKEIIQNFISIQKENTARGGDNRVRRSKSIHFSSYRTIKSNQ